MAGDEDFLSRWSRRKVEARAAPPAQAPQPAKQGALPESPREPIPGPVEPAPLPPLESLTPESDFAPFMAADVDGGVRRQALKTLFSDPRFNVMDMMDVYVDDYSKPDPIPESWMSQLQQLSRLGDRAGWDREEAERRRALEQQVAEAGNVPATPYSDAPASEAEDSRAISGPPAGPDSSEKGETAEAPIPPSAVRESDT
jgi:hypothetical protein